MVTDDRVWVSIPMPPELKARIVKAAAKNDMSNAEYLRMAVTTYMQRAGEWTVRGPKKGTR